jgi:hypothetical protein
MLVNVKEPLYSRVKKIVKHRPFKYVSIQQFVNLAVKEKIEKEVHE